MLFSDDVNSQKGWYKLDKYNWSYGQKIIKPNQFQVARIWKSHECEQGEWLYFIMKITCNFKKIYYIWQKANYPNSILYVIMITSMEPR